MKPWDAKKILYIKLGKGVEGKGGKYWKTCKKEKKIRLGYQSGSADIYNWAMSGQWEEVNKYWKQAKKNNTTATSYTNQMKQFFNDDGKTLWITFEEGCLYYAFTDGEIIRDPDHPDPSYNNTSYRRLTAEGWKNVDKENKPLRTEDLSTILTKTAAYRQTICTLEEKAINHLYLKLKGEVSSDLIKTRDSLKNLEKSIKPLIQSLSWQDFELLVELIFSNSGWQKTTKIGGTQKITDLDLKNSITGEKIFVQVKSKTNAAEFKKYKEKHIIEKSDFKTMYFVYHTGNHTGKIGNIINEDHDKRVEVWNLEKVAMFVVYNGLTKWLMDKSK